jgi:hypothetical protein
LTLCQQNQQLDLRRRQQQQQQQQQRIVLRQSTALRLIRWAAYSAAVAATFVRTRDCWSVDCCKSSTAAAAAG